MAWDSSGYPDLAAKWPTVTYIKQFVAIQQFLIDEDEIRSALGTILVRTLGRKGDSLIAYLRREENDLGFNYDVVTLDGVVSAHTFLSHVGAKKPIDDLGVGKSHGRFTHRLQWLLIGIHDEETKFVTGTGVTVGDVYADMGSAMRPGAPNVNLWNDLLDRGSKGSSGNRSGTACSPEFLNDQLLRFSYEPLYERWNSAG